MLLKKVLTLSTMCFTYYNAVSQVGIGTVSPDVSAILEVQSDTKGFLPPRLITDGEVSSPTEGLVIYDESDNCLNVYSGTAWINLCSNNTSGGGNTGSGANEFPWETNLRFRDMDLNSKNYQGAAITTDNNLYMWGYDNNNYIGEEFNTTTITSPALAYVGSPIHMNAPEFLDNVADFNLSEHAYFVRTLDNKLFSWGNQEFAGHPYTGTVNASNGLHVVTEITVPTGEGNHWVKISENSGRFSANGRGGIIAITDEGSAFYTGNMNTTLSSSTGIFKFAEPTGAPAGFKYVNGWTANKTTALLLDNQNKLYITGIIHDKLKGNAATAAGTYNPTTSSGIKEIILPAGIGAIKKVALSENNYDGCGYILTEDGDMFAWGSEKRAATSLRLFLPENPADLVSGFAISPVPVKKIGTAKILDFSVYKSTQFAFLTDEDKVYYLGSYDGIGDAGSMIRPYLPNPASLTTAYSFNFFDDYQYSGIENVEKIKFGHTGSGTGGCLILQKGSNRMLGYMYNFNHLLGGLSNTSTTKGPNQTNAIPSPFYNGNLDRVNSRPEPVN